MAGQWDYMWMRVGESKDGLAPIQDAIEFPVMKAGESLQDYLNSLGDDRWEMCSAIPTGNVVQGPLLFFKRAKQ
jgi:hypothetical protein